MDNAPLSADSTTLHAEIAADGGRIFGSAGFLERGVADISAFLAGFLTIDGKATTAAVVDAAAEAWRDAGAPMTGVAPDGGRWMLCAHPTLAGGCSLLAAPTGDGPARPDGGEWADDVLERHPLPVFAYDADTGEIFLQNAQARALLAPNEALARPARITDFFWKDDLYLQAMAALKDSGRIAKRRLRAEASDGRQLWAFVTGALIKKNGVETVVLTIDDVASLERHEADIETTHELLQDALRSLSEGFALFDEDGRLIVSNDRYREINAGIAEFVMPGVHWETLLREMARRRLPVYAAGRMNAWINEVMRATEAFESFEIERTDGATINVAVKPTTLGGFIVTTSDITARRIAEQSASDSEQMLSTILEASPANLCMSRIGDGEIIYQSPSCIRLFGAGVPAKQQFANPIDRADFLTDLLPVGAVEDFPADARNAAGETFPALFSGRIIDFRGEDVLVSTVTDLTEIKAAEREIRDASRRLRDAIEALNEGFVIFDADQRVVKANQRYLSMNAPYSHLIRPGALNRDIIAAAAASGHLIDGEDWLRVYDDEQAAGRIATHRVDEFRLADGSWIRSLRRPTREGGIVITWVDFTEEKRAAAEIRRSNDRLRDAIESLDEGFALYDAADRLVTWNQRYEDLHDNIAGMMREGDLYTDILEAAVAANRLPETEIEKVRVGMSRGESNEKRRFEFQHSDGRWFAVVRQPTSESGFVITRQDITERKLAEQAEREADETLRRILEACPVNLIMCRMSDGKLTYVSENTAEIFGRRDYVSEYWADRAEGVAMSREIRKSGQLDQRVIDLFKRDGTPIRVALSSRKIVLQGEEMVVSQAFDLTERIKLEEELARQLEMLHQSEKLSALGELLAGVAHELNNPLSVVVGHALMLEEEIEDPELLKRTSRISAAAERCARIVKTFLAMARQRPAQMERTSINGVIETALDVAGYGLRSANVRVDSILTDDLPPVMADPDQLAQVFANLIVNAENVLAPLGKKGRLTLRTALSAEGGEVVIDVIDNGPGIPEAIRARIFEPFFTTKSVGEGTGIGLAFCHRIVASHEGRISVSQADGGGARFTIHLAVAPPEHGVDDATEAPASQRGAVLVIDDEPNVGELIAQILKKDGYEVVLASSAEDALKRLPGAFDLILSDLNMPGLGGRAFFDKAQQTWPALTERIGFITGDTMSPGAEAFLQAAGRPYLEKPVVPAELRKLAASMMAEL